MREIKFRAWDGDTMSDNDVGVVDGKAVDFDGEALWYWHEQPIAIMQYTGLKDRNGVEIYEDDVVQVYDLGWLDPEDDTSDFGFHQKARVDVVLGGCTPPYWLRDEEWGYEGENLSNPENTEVIGNIYENPELLN